MQRVLLPFLLLSSYNLIDPQCACTARVMVVVVSVCVCACVCVSVCLLSHISP